MPSQWLEDEDERLDPWARYCLDETVCLFGMIIENALHIYDEVTRGDHKERKPRYSLSQLLDPAFRLPRDNGHGDTLGPIHSTGDGALIVDEVT